MKHSNLIRFKDNLLNYYSSTIENCVSTIVTNKIHSNDDFIVGINCFDELLFNNEFISYARDNF